MKRLADFEKRLSILEKRVNTQVGRPDLKLEQAKNYLTKAFPTVGTIVKTKDIFKRAESLGISKLTLRRARYLMRGLCPIIHNEYKHCWQRWYEDDDLCNYIWELLDNGDVKEDMMYKMIKDQGVKNPETIRNLMIKHGLLKVNWEVSGKPLWSLKNLRRGGL